MTRIGRGLSVGVALAAGVALLALPDSSAEAGRRRAKRKRSRVHFLQQEPAPMRDRSPAAASGAAWSGELRPVADGPMSAPHLLDAYQAGAEVVLRDGLALALSAHRGLCVVDVSDPSAPTLLATVPVDGTARGLLVEGDHAIVVSDAVAAADAERQALTEVLAVDLRIPADPAVVGRAQVPGRAVEWESGGDGGTLLVTTSWPWLDPWYAPALLDDPEMAQDRPGYEGATTLVRLPPPSGGEWTADLVELNGTVERSLLVDGRADLLLRRPLLARPTGSFGLQPEGSQLVLVSARHAAGGAGWEVASDADLLSADFGVVALGRVAGGAVALVAGSSAGVELLTFTTDFAAAEPFAPAAELPLADWPHAHAFSGDRFVYAGGSLDYGTGRPEVSGESPGFAGGLREWEETTKPDLAPVASRLGVVDLADPAHPTLATVDLDTAWVADLRPVPGGALLTLFRYDGATRIVRADLADPAHPVTATAEVPAGWWSLQSVVDDDLALLAGGDYDAEGGYVPALVAVDLADGALDVGAPFEAGGWATAAAHADGLLALASFDRLRLVEVADVAAPRALGDVRLVVNAADLVPLGDDAVAVLVTDWSGGRIEIRTVALPGADALAPLDVLELGRGDGRLFADGAMLYVVATDWTTGRARLDVVDATDPADLRRRGSLDLSSYPGQAFLHRGALILLREAWSVVGWSSPFEPTEPGAARKRRARDPRAEDAFGRGRTRWTRDALGAVLDVVDLSDPDRPRAAVREHLRWDAFGGQARLDGDTLYVPSHWWYPDSDGFTWGGGWSYGVRAIGVADPLRPRIGPDVEVPGTLVATTDEAGVVVVAAYDHDPATWALRTTLHLVDLTRPWRERVLASRELEGSLEVAVAHGEQVFAVTSGAFGAGGEVPPGTDPSTGATFLLPGGPVPVSSGSLVTLALPDLAEVGTQPRNAGAFDGLVEGGHLFLRRWGWEASIDAYRLAPPGEPVGAGSLAVAGAAPRVVVADGRAYVPGGLRGIVVLPLE